MCRLGFQHWFVKWRRVWIDLFDRQAGASKDTIENGCQGLGLTQRGELGCGGSGGGSPRTALGSEATIGWRSLQV